MSKTKKVVSIILSIFILIIMQCSVFANTTPATAGTVTNTSPAQDVISPSATINSIENKVGQKVKINVINETMTTDETTGVITKRIEFTYGDDSNSQKIQSDNIQQAAAASAQGWLEISLTPDYYAHSVEINWTLYSNEPMFGWGSTNCFMDNDESLTQIDRCMPMGQKFVEGQFNYYFGVPGSHFCDVLCSYVDPIFGPIYPDSGVIPFSV